MCHFQVQNGPFVINKFFLVQTIIITFIYLLALFIEQNFKKNSYSESRVMRMRHFWTPNGSFDPNNLFFFLKKINIIFIYLLVPFILQNFKQILRANPELWGCAIFRPKILEFALKFFFGHKPLLLLSFTYWPFSLSKIFKKNLTSAPELWGCANFGPKIVHLPQTIFFLENYQYHFHLPISPFHCAKF